jgi:diguanylate cyclase (GGDEF)-like protein
LTPSRRRTAWTLLLAGFTSIVVAVASLAWFATDNMDRLRSITEDLYRHPFAVSNAASDLRGTLFQLRGLMLQTVFVQPRSDRVSQMRAEANGLARASRADLRVIKDQFLGDLDRVQELEQRLDEWDAIRANIFTLAEHGDLPGAEALVRSVGTPQFERIVPLVDYVLGFARDKGREFADESHRQALRLDTESKRWAAMAVLFVIVTGIMVSCRVLSLQNKLERQATLDFLTGIPNRRHFLELAERERQRGLRYGTPFALAVMDLDFFKAINDTHGHHVGDLVLKQFCAVCRDNLRASDILGRIGGEEFAILLPGASEAEAKYVLERVRAAVAASPISVGSGIDLGITASFGLALASSGEEELDSLFQRVDVALYEAKQSGRNRICFMPV